jgi:aldose 1-epimerase
VAGSPFDFTRPTAIGARIDAADPQIQAGGGYDHNYVLKNQSGKLARAASVTEPTSGRTLTVLTTEPGVQFYTGNFLDGSIQGKGGVKYRRRSAFCLETQHYPDSPNQAGFPSVVRKAGMRYKSQTVFQFGVRK